MMSLINIGPKWKTLLVVALACTLCQCSNKEGKEKDFKVRMDTQNPLVRTTKRKVGTKELQPNWFDFSFRVQNNTNERVRIEEILLYYAIDGAEQAPISYDLSILQVQTDDGITYDYVDYCIYPKNDIQERRFSACLVSAVDVTDATFRSGTVPAVVPLNMYIDGLKNLPTTSKVYVMRVELIGVFIDDGDVESSRFTKRFTFTTR